MLEVHVDLLRGNLELRMLCSSGPLRFRLSVTGQLLLLLHRHWDLWCDLERSEHNTASLGGEGSGWLDGSSGRRSGATRPRGETHSWVRLS